MMAWISVDIQRPSIRQVKIFSGWEYGSLTEYLSNRPQALDLVLNVEVWLKKIIIYSTYIHPIRIMRVVD